MTDLAQIGFAADTAPLEKASESLDKMGRSAKGSSSFLEKMQQEMNKMVRQARSLEQSMGLGATATDRMTKELIEMVIPPFLMGLRSRVRPTWPTSVWV